MTKLASIINRHNLTPGSNIEPYVDVSQSTINRWEKLGWIEDRGRYVLTMSGWRDN